MGEEEDDLRDDLRGLPLERMMGVLGVRGRELECGGDGGEKKACRSVEGEEVGKGTALVSARGRSMWVGGLTEGEKRPDWMERRRELFAGA